MSDLKIGLAFSGGGFRAAAFSLGTLSYLDKLKAGERSLLQHVIALSTVSGGTITGARYALGISKGETVKDIFQELYTFLKETDIVMLALDRLESDKIWQGERVKSLINAFADVYHTELFKGAAFGEVMKDSLHLRHISFNATEFSNALQFRFQWSEKVASPKENEPERGIIGNKYLQVPEADAREIRLADVLAASSCFPGGFEPINFPTDFFPSDSPVLQNLRVQFPEPVGLMDGGIVDNQGISPLLLANRRMNRSKPEGEVKQHSFDLLIIADVASPFMESFVASQPLPDKGLWTWSPFQLLTANTVILLASMAGVVYSIMEENTLLAVLSSVFLTLSVIIYLTSRFLFSLPEKFEVPAKLMKPIGKLLNIKLGTYSALIMNRVRSLIKLSGEVFLKHVRRLNYSTLYDDPFWENRRIMSAIYEAANVPDHIRRVRPNHKEFGKMAPSVTVRQTADTAWSMGTTLWFTEEELRKKNMLNCLIATGQFTLCWNLLEYITRLKKDKSNTNPNHNEILKLEGTIAEHWERFQSNPFWLLTEYQRNSKS